MSLFYAAFWFITGFIALAFFCGCVSVLWNPEITDKWAYAPLALLSGGWLYRSIRLTARYYQE